MRIPGLFLLAFLGVACAHTTRLFPISYELIDLPEQRRLELTFKNRLRYAVCLLPEFWPNAAGKIDHASSLVYLVVETRRFPIEEFNTGYCPDCPLRVEPGDEVKASIGYEAFALPDAHLGKEKRLIFSPKGYRCD